MTINMVWIDKNWQSRGVAENRYLRIRPDNKTFSYATSYWIPNAPGTAYFDNEFIEVKRLKDLDAYVKRLIDEGFEEVKQIEKEVI